MRSVLVTGKNGQLGQSLQKIVNTYHRHISASHCELSSGHCERSEAIPIEHYDFTFVGRDELNLVSSQSIADYFQDKQFDAIIHCAAYTAVDKAESEPELADQINHRAVKQLAEIAKQQNTLLIYISTDYVFDGTHHKPYIETDKTSPMNVYGLTKLKGEQAMQASGCKGAIIRTSWVYSEFGHNFVKTMLRLGKARASLDVIVDQIGSPTYATDLANAVLALLNTWISVTQLSHSVIEKNTSVIASEAKQSHTNLDFHIAGISGNHTGVEVYHYSNEGVCSWYDFAKTIFEMANIPCQVNPIHTKDYPTPAKRPLYSVMNTAKIQQALLMDISDWRYSLKIALRSEEFTAITRITPHCEQSEAIQNNKTQQRAQESKALPLPRMRVLVKRH